MGRRLCLDTGVLVSLERDHSFASALRPDDDICLPMIVVAEYLTGIMLARPTSRPRLQLFIDHVLETVAVLPYDEEILDTHVALRAWTYQDGRPRGQHDLIIAATAVVTGRTLLTLDHKAKFDELPGLTVEYPQGR